jgi:hypothetical protein
LTRCPLHRLRRMSGAIVVSRRAASFRGHGRSLLRCPGVSPVRSNLPVNAPGGAPAGTVRRCTAEPILVSGRMKIRKVPIARRGRAVHRTGRRRLLPPAQISAIRTGPAGNPPASSPSPWRDGSMVRGLAPSR